uniref:Rap1 Myb domain-containing protein n=1 Tax=Moniliophthora roreri TaxID=221103 RepID=A0A0W0G5L2_MONRR
MSCSTQIPRLPPSRTLSPDDDHFLVSFIARNNPQVVGRRGDRLYKKLAEEKNDGRTWRQWKRRYITNSEEFDRLIQLYLAGDYKPPAPPQNLPSPTPVKRVGISSPRKGTELSSSEKDALINYLATNTKDQGIRRGQAIYRDVVDNVGGYSPWGVRRSVSNWRSYYLDHADEIETRIHEIGTSTHGSLSSKSINKVVRIKKEDAPPSSLLLGPFEDPRATQNRNEIYEVMARYFAQQKKASSRKVGFASLRTWEGFAGQVAKSRTPGGWKSYFYASMDKPRLEALINQYTLGSSYQPSSSHPLPPPPKNEPLEDPESELVYPPGQELDPELESNTESPATPVIEYSFVTQFTSTDLYLLRELELLPRAGTVFKVNEDLLFLKYLASQPDSHRSRRAEADQVGGGSVYERFVKDIPGAGVHMPQAWGQRYILNWSTFDRLIKEYQKKPKRTATAHLPTPSSLDRPRAPTHIPIHTHVTKSHQASPTKRTRPHYVANELVLPTSSPPKKRKLDVDEGISRKGKEKKDPTSSARPKLILKIPALKDRIRLYGASKTKIVKTES